MAKRRKVTPDDDDQDSIISPTCSGENEGGLQRKAVRHDGWTLARRQTFLDALVETSNISKSCRKVGMTLTGLYALRRREPAFHAHYQDALEEGYGRLEMEMLERARFGVNRPVFFGGKKIATVKNYSDNTGLRILERHESVAAKVRALRAEGKDQDASPDFA